MDFLQLLSDIEQVDPEVYDRLDSRRAVFRHLGNLGQKLTAAALPLAVGAVFNKAYAQTPAGLAVADVLNFALKLEYLEAYFYLRRPAALFNANELASLALIATDETNHVNFLRTVIAAVGGTPIAAPPTAAFDYSAGGIFSNWQTNADTYLALAQAFEDTGVRAYKGVAPLTSVMANKAVLTATFNIHSMEARHAAQIRAIRRARVTSSATAPSQGLPVSPYSAAPKSWISGTDNGGPASPYTAPVYGAGNDTGAATYGSTGATGPSAGVTFPAESSTIQGGIPLAGAVLVSVPQVAFTEAFDEGLDVSTVSAIARQFVAAGYTIF